MADELMSPKEVHEEYGFSPQTLSNWRWMGIGPNFIKTTPAKAGRIRYRRRDIEAYLDSRTVQTGGTAA